jgi:hypothetical protein
VFAPPLPPLAVIGNPENRRVAMFGEAARRLGWQAPGVVAYEHLLTISPTALADHLAESVPAAALVRIESPGENPAVEAALIRRGAGLLGLNDRQTETVLAAAAMHGRIAGSAQWFAGYVDLLRQIETALAPRGVRWMNHPTEIPILFDKPRCQALLVESGVSVPAALAAAARQPPSCFGDLLAQLDRRGWSRVFIKLRYGSSASGVVAFEHSRRGMQATTSVELVYEGGEARLFNSLRVRRYTNPAEITAIVDELCRQCIHVEQWVPKASWAGRTFDLRIVTIAGQPRHVVMRTSRGPITNLHLGNQRGDVAELLARWEPLAQQSAWSTCRAAAACFARCRYLGIDLALLPGLKRHALLELNAFGDLLPGIRDSAGDDTYAAQLRSDAPASH